MSAPCMHVFLFSASTPCAYIYLALALTRDRRKTRIGGHAARILCFSFSSLCLNAFGVWLPTLLTVCTHHLWFPFYTFTSNSFWKIQQQTWHVPQTAHKSTEKALAEARHQGGTQICASRWWCEEASLHWELWLSQSAVPEEHGLADPSFVPAPCS